MELNRDLIQARFRDIRESLERLEPIRALSQEAFLADRDTLDIACYRLLVAIEAAVQICFHVAARGLGKVPEEYAECFSILSEAGIVDPGLGGQLQQMARFRNMLVHRYWDVDYGIVYEILQDRLDDLRQFMRAVGEFV